MMRTACQQYLLSVDHILDRCQSIIAMHGTLYGAPQMYVHQIKHSVHAIVKCHMHHGSGDDGV